MDFGAIIGTAWRITLRYRGLWLLGLFAGGPSTSLNLSTNTGAPTGGGDSADLDAAFRNLPDVFDELPALWEQFLPYLIGGLLVLAVVYVAFWLLSIACKAALIAGGGEAAQDNPVGLGRAWSVGMRAFGRLFLLDLLLHLVALAVAALLAVIVISGFRRPPASAGEVLGALGVVFGVLVIVGLIASLIGVVVTYAQRAIVLDGTDTWQGLGAAVTLARTHLGNSLLLWLVAVVLSIAGGIAIVLGAIVFLIPAGLVSALVGFLASLVGGQDAFLPALLIVLVPLVLAFAIVAAAALNTFIWHFWTVGYLRLSRAA